MVGLATHRVIDGHDGQILRLRAAFTSPHDSPLENAPEPLEIGGLDRVSIAAVRSVMVVGVPRADPVQLEAPSIDVPACMSGEAVPRHAPEIDVVEVLPIRDGALSEPARPPIRTTRAGEPA